MKHHDSTKKFDKEPKLHNHYLLTPASPPIHDIFHFEHEGGVIRGRARINLI